MDDYLIRKKPLQALIIFALPMIIGNFFQQFYTMADSVIVGRYVSEQALAAIGASASFTNIFIFIATGGGIGASVIVSQYFGAKEFAGMKRAVNTALITFLIISFVFAGFGLLFGEKIMILLNTPEDTLGLAVEYLRIYFLGLPFLFMYNVFSSMFNALGKSRIPLYFLIFSSIFNIVLDYYMVTELNLGVSGVAWATMIAQGISAVLSFSVFLREMKRYRESAGTIFAWSELTSMTRIALPSIFQQSTVSIGMMFVQSVVNSFGSQALAGFTAGVRVESLCIVPMAAIGNAISSYTAQNIGAGKEERVVEGYREANKLVILFAVVICLILQCFNEEIVLFFLGETGTEIAISTGQTFMSFLGWFYCLIGFKMAADGVLRGAGDMKMFTIANLVNLSIRVIWSITLAPVFGIAMIWTAIPIGWFVNWAISFSEYRTGKWKTIRINK